MLHSGIVCMGEREGEGEGIVCIGEGRGGGGIVCIGEIEEGRGGEGRGRVLCA